MILLSSCSDDDNNNNTDELALNEQSIFTLKGVSYSINLWVANQLFVGVCIDRQDEVPFQSSDLILKKIEVYNLGNGIPRQIIEFSSTNINTGCDGNGFCHSAGGEQVEFEQILANDEIGLIVHFSDENDDYFIDSNLVAVQGGVPTSWGVNCM